MCKMAHFGNCDPETADQEYCIFHKPDKTEEEAVEFYRKFLERFEHEIILGIRHPAVINSVVFKEELHCEGFVFPRNLPNNFELGVDLWWGTVFEENAIFSEATFEGYALFAGAKFNAEAWFDKVVFQDHANFVGATFKGLTMFSEAYFEDEADFMGATFESVVMFDRAIFKGDVNFNETTFEEVPEFTGKWKAEKYKFYGGLNFSHADIRKGININIPSEWFKLPEAEIEARRVQRLSYEKEGKRDEADRMFVLERRAYRKVLKNRAKEKYSNAKMPYQKFEAILFLIYVYISTAIEAILADWISLYGTSWGRIILSSFWVITVNAILYQALSHFSHVVILGIPIGTIYTNGASEGIPGLLNALYYSLVTFTTLGYGDMHPTGWLKALSAIEALTGAVFMALIVAVIARKWMR